MSISMNSEICDASKERNQKVLPLIKKLNIRNSCTNSWEGRVEVELSLQPLHEGLVDALRPLR